MNGDFSSRLVRRALDILVFNHPFHTSMGILLGAVVGFFVPVFSPTLKEFTSLDFSLVPFPGWLLMGVLLSNLKPWIRPPTLSKEAEEALALIERAKQAGISDLEIKQKYKTLIQNYVDNVALNEETQKKLEELQERNTNA